MKMNSKPSSNRILCTYCGIDFQRMSNPAGVVDRNRGVNVCFKKECMEGDRVALGNQTGDNDEK